MNLHPLTLNESRKADERSEKAPVAKFADRSVQFNFDVGHSELNIKLFISYRHYLAS